MGQRQPKLTVVSAAKGGGKSHLTCHMISKYIKNNPKTGKLARKVLIYDVNGEFTSKKLREEYKVDFDAPVLALKDLAEWTKQKRIEVRRILPLDENNVVVDDIDIMVGILNTILQTFRGGLLLLEDINAYLIGTTTKQVISSITRNRHKDLDIIIHLQSLRAMSPRLWANSNLTRFHKQMDNIAAYQDRINNPELYYIAESLVNYKFQFDIRFYVWIDNEYQKISGKFSKKEYWLACYNYLLENPSATRQARQRFGTSAEGKKKMYEYCINNLMKYYGN